MISYKELIKEDKFDIKDYYLVKTHITKLCWRCETAHKEGYMVKDVSKGRRFFFCQNCFDQLKS